MQPPTPSSPSSSAWTTPTPSNRSKRKSPPTPEQVACPDCGEMFLADLAGLDDAEPATETPKPKAKPKPGPVTKVACPDCGKLYAPGTGLGVHRSRVHPDSAAKPVEPIEPIEPTPEPEPELDVETDQPAAAGAYECETCDFTPPGVDPVRARAICADCEVQIECFEAAVADGDIVGFWGGASEKARKIERRRRERAGQPIMPSRRHEDPATGRPRGGARNTAS